MPTPRHKPTEASRREVAAYAAVGTPHEDIARLVGLAPNTLTKYYRQELDTSKARATAQVGRTLFQMATVDKNVAAAIFWMKTQAGWRERSELDVRHPDGGGAQIVFYIPQNGRD